jgi:SAM-dependent methyltransferase
MRVPVGCPVCESTRQRVKWSPRVKLDDPSVLYGAASGVRDTQRLVACLDCGMVYESPRFPEPLIVKGYEQAADEHDSQFAQRADCFRRALNSLNRHLPPPPADVLDVGTAGGAFLMAASELGYRAQGLDPSIALVEQGKKRGLSITQGTLDCAPSSPHTFDLVCLWDVLEHVADPFTVLSQCKRLLRPGGVLLINFPDIGTWPARLAGRWYWWLLSVHLHHFSKPTLKKLCARAGLEVFYFQRFWARLELGYLFQMAARLRIPGASTAIRWTPSVLQKAAVSYTAAQTTALARLVP